jgi:hypothetical protein
VALLLLLPSWWPHLSVSLESFLFLERTVRMPLVTATGTATAAAASQDMPRLAQPLGCSSSQISW